MLNMFSLFKLIILYNSATLFSKTGKENDSLEGSKLEETKTDENGKLAAKQRQQNYMINLS